MKRSNSFQCFVIILFAIVLFPNCQEDFIDIDFDESNSSSNNARVGSEVFRTIESAHPYPSGIGKKKNIAWRDTIHEAGATYLALHFEKVQLRQEDFLIVRSLDGSRSWNYTVKSSQLQLASGFWSIPIYGDKMIVEIQSMAEGNEFGYKIDKIAKGFANINTSIGSSCGKNDSSNIACETDPNILNNAKAVARVLVNGIYYATGFLVGSEGHFITNKHVIKNEIDAANTSIEFLAKGRCEEFCLLPGYCPGIIEATAVELITTSEALDYSLIKLPSSVTNTYGYLKIRLSAPIVGEILYVIHHPFGGGQVLSIRSGSSAAIILSTEEQACGSTSINGFTHNAYTKTGSSGAPILSAEDHTVIGIHQCNDGGECSKKGVLINLIVKDLQDENIDIPNGIATEETPPPVTARDSWETVEDVPQEDLYAIHMVEEDFIIVVGGKGTVLKSTNGGITWISSNQGIDSNSYLYSTFFIDKNTGYAVGNFGSAYKTRNGGRTWERFNITNHNLRSVFFLNAQKGFIVADSAIFRTTDGGENWENVTTTLPIGISEKDLISAEIFFTEEVGFILLQSKLLKTINGGDSWKKIPLEGLATYDIDFVDQQLGFICGIGTGLLTTSNGGDEWTRVLSLAINRPTTVKFKNENKGVVAGSSGEIYLTENGGEVWQKDTSPTDQDLHQIIFLPEQNTFIAIGKKGTILMKSE